MKRLTLPVLLLTVAALAPAQSLPEYLRLRKAFGVTQAASIGALQELNGTKVMELKGVVKGSFKMGARTSLIVERAGGDSQTVDTDVVADWLVEGEAPARFLVKATHDTPSSAPRVVLIAVAHESDIQALEDKERARQAKLAATTAAKKKEQPRPSAMLVSRGGSGSLSGRIGRGGSYHPATRQWYLPTSQVTPIYASYIKHVNRRLPDEEAMTMAKAIVGFCAQYGVDPRLVMAVIFCESGFDPNSVSHSGAMGLGQLMPDTARWMGVSNPFDSIENLNGMIKLLRTHFDSYRQNHQDYESLVLTLAAYNAGAGAVKRHGGVPPYRETQRYVRKVLDLYYRMLGSA